MSDSVTELSERLRKVVGDRDWKQFHNPTQLAMDISVEAGELLELFQWKLENELPKLMVEKRAKIGEELADVFLSCLKFANFNNIDIIAAAWNKVEEMEKKYPVEKAKGSNRKYNEL